MTKVGLLSLDVEDWYHLDYIKSDAHVQYTMLDGLDRFLELTSKLNVVSTLFVLADVVPLVRDTLLLAKSLGHEIAIHGVDHRRPLTRNVDEFRDEINLARNIIQNELQVDPVGYRAPCFSLDRARLNVIKDDIGLLYDSSRISFSENPVYGFVDVSDFKTMSKGVYVSDHFVEFEMPVSITPGKSIPIGGGGYLRLLPWWFYSTLVGFSTSSYSVFPIYVHPYELSKVDPPLVPGLSRLNSFRFRHNISSTPQKLSKLVCQLKAERFMFDTYSNCRENLLR